MAIKEATGRTLEVAVSAQAAFGTVIDAETGTLDPVRINKCDIIPDRPWKWTGDKNNRTRFEPVELAETGNVDLEMVLRPAATLAGTMDGVGVFTRGGFTAGTNAATTVAASPAPTTTTFTLTSATSYAKGQTIMVNNTTDGVVYRHITDLTGAAVTFAPAMTTAPTAADVVNNGIALLPNTMTTPLGLSVYRYLGGDSTNERADECAMANSMVPGEFAFSFGNDSEVTLGVTGQCQQVGITNHQELRAQLDSGATSMAAAVGLATMVAKDMILTVGSTEHIKVGAITITGRDFTTASAAITRDHNSSGDTNQAAGVVLYPHRPAMTYQTTTAIGPKDVELLIYPDSSAVPATIKMASGTLTISNAVTPIGPRAGQNSSMTDARGGVLDVTLSFDGYYAAGDIATGSELSTAFLQGLQEYRSDVGVQIRLGKASTTGGAFLITCPTMIVETAPTVDSTAEGFIPISMTLKARGTTSQLDEISMAQL